MTPQQKIKWMILALAVKAGYLEALPEITADNVDELYASRAAGHDDVVFHLEETLRPGDFRTDLVTSTSRYFSSYAVATQAPDGSWVGWTYWYGGDVRNHPEAMQWKETAYDLTCVETQEMTTVRRFTAA